MTDKDDFRIVQIIIPKEKWESVEICHDENMKIYADFMPVIALGLTAGGRVFFITPFDNTGENTNYTRKVDGDGTIYSDGQIFTDVDELLRASQ